MTQAKEHILYIGAVEEGTCKARKQALEHFGHKVTTINTKDYFQGIHRFGSGLYYRFLYGPRTVRFNENLLRIAEQGALDWVWVDKGTFVHNTV